MVDESVELDFSLDAKDLAQSVSHYRTLGPGELGDGALFVTWFLYPTWLRVGGIDVLALGKSVRDVAVLGLAWDLPCALAELTGTSQAECAVFGANARLLLTRLDSQVRVRVLESGLEAVASLHELQRATKRFAKRVATILTEALPEAFTDDMGRLWADWALDDARLDSDWRSGA
jgi:hypothetical protein